ncbi:MAG: 5'-nucleotidase, lipoprotein e(P4) family [Rhodothermus sp.]|nr:5'-nucleotidase, lipoprotein e(P4) family [Rhodothermus sp.]
MKGQHIGWMGGLLAVGLLAGCVSGRSALRHAGLLSTRWVQTSAEYTALALQAYATARRQLERALADSTWTAYPPQAFASDLFRRPPAVIVDVDETVLDNSPYQAWLITTGQNFSSASWARWTQAAQAQPVPGAVTFVQAARQRGVLVFYVTNRTADLEEATRRNLQAVGFPLPDTVDVILTRGERPEWATADKEPRRAFLGRRYRILLQIGDQLGDFLPEPAATVEARRALVRRYHTWWGTRWIVLPNPQYGAWQHTPDGLRPWQEHSSGQAAR